MKNLFHLLILTEIVRMAYGYTAVIGLRAGLPMPWAVELALLFTLAEALAATALLGRLVADWPVKLPVEYEVWVLGLFGPIVASLIFGVVLCTS